MTTEARALAAPRLDARALLWLTVLAVGLVGARAALRGLHVPGHAALPTLFCLVAARAVAARPGAALAVGTPAALGGALGLVAGPGGAVSLLLAVGAVEVAGWLAPRFVTSVAACAAVGALAGVLRAGADLPGLAAGLPDPGASLLLASAGHAAFGALGAALVPQLRRRRESGSQAGG